MKRPTVFSLSTKLQTRKVYNCRRLCDFHRQTISQV